MEPSAEKQTYASVIFHSLFLNHPKIELFYYIIDQDSFLVILYIDLNKY